MTQVRSLHTDSSTAELSVITERRLADPRPGTRPTIRPIRQSDDVALAEMALRCSADSLRHRFHAPVQHMDPTRLVDHLRGRAAADTLVADVDGAVVGIATLHRTGTRTADMAVLVEDRWQSGRVGTRLAGRLLRRAAELGLTTVAADVQREQGFVIDRLMRAVDGSAVTFDGPTATLALPVPSTPCPPGSPAPAAP